MYPVISVRALCGRREELLGGRRSAVRVHLRVHRYSGSAAAHFIRSICELESLV